MAVISAEELEDQAELSYIRGTYEVALLDSEETFDQTVVIADIVADEVVAGTGGYARLTFTYEAADIAAYSNGQPLSQKIANFVHDGSSEDIVFTHVALIRNVGGTRTVVGVESVGSTAVLSNGETAAVNINLLHGRP